MKPNGKIPFGEWLPDQPALENPGLVEAKNVIPIDRYYKAFLSFSPGADDALASRPYGAYAAVDTSGNPEIYAGTVDGLFQKVSSAWTDRSGATYTTGTGSYWRFAQFDNWIIATNFDDLPQIREIGSSDNFADIATTGDEPQGRQVGVIGRFIMFGDTEDSLNGAMPYRVQWSGIDDPRNWPTPATQAARSVQSGEQILNSAYGAVTAIANGQTYGLVFQQRAITRFTYVGGDVVFQIQDYERTRGCWAPQSMIQIGDLCYFLAVDGFYVTNGQTVTPLGNEKVDQWVLNRIDQGSRERVTAAFDYATKCIYWSIPTTSSGGEPALILIYSIARNRFAWAEQSLQLLLQSYTEGVTLEDLDALYPGGLETITIPFDSSFWTGGVPAISGFTEDTTGTFSGAALTARFETGESDINPFGYALVLGVRPLVTGNPTNVAVSISNRERQDNESPVFGLPATRTVRTGVCDFRENAKYFSARVDIEGGFDRAMGIELEAVQGDGV